MTIRARRWWVIPTVAGLVGLVALGGLMAFLVVATRSPSCPEQERLSQPDPGACRGDRGEVRHDVDALLRSIEPTTASGAFAGEATLPIGEPVAAAWQSGAFDRGNTIGPPGGWLDAVIHLEPGRARQLANEYGATPVEAPRIDPDLAPSLTDGPWVSSPELGQALSGSYGGSVLLDVEDDRLVLLLARLG